MCCREPWQSKKADPMNDVPVSNIEETKLSQKKESRAGITATGVGDTGRCAEGEQLKQQYESALQEWRQRSQPEARHFIGGEASRAFQMREEALIERNAAANRMYLHRTRCSFCKRQR
jgi:hypothetical protein